MSHARTPEPERTTVGLRRAPRGHQPTAGDHRAADLARHLRRLVAARDARRRAIAGSSMHVSRATAAGDHELGEIQRQLDLALADAEDQCRRRFHDPIQAITALQERAVPTASRWDDLVDLVDLVGSTAGDQGASDQPPRPARFAS